MSVKPQATWRARRLLAVDFTFTCDARELHLRPRRIRRTQSHCIKAARYYLQCALRRDTFCGAKPSAVDFLQAPLQAVAQRGHFEEVG